MAIMPQAMRSPRHQKVWSSSGASRPCSLTSSPATTIVSPSMTLAGPARGPTRQLSVKMAARPVARRISIRDCALPDLLPEYERVGL